MRIFIKEDIQTPSLENDVNFILSLIAKEITDHFKIFLPERKLITNIKKTDVLNKYKFYSIEIFEDLDKNKSTVEIKENRFRKDTLLITLGKDFYEKFLEFRISRKGISKLKKIEPFKYTLMILKLSLQKQLSFILENKLRFKE